MSSNIFQARIVIAIVKEGRFKWRQARLVFRFTIETIIITICNLKNVQGYKELK